MEPKMLWRPGRTVARTVYIQRFDEPSKADQLVGLMDTPGLAGFVCACVNYVLTHDIDPLAIPDPPKA
jgi:hypothetical protein